MKVARRSFTRLVGKTVATGGVRALARWETREMPGYNSLTGTEEQALQCAVARRCWDKPTMRCLSLASDQPEGGDRMVEGTDRAGRRRHGRQAADLHPQGSPWPQPARSEMPWA
jgi:hypothetical protein